ncbi:hypothetical protein [Neobacillus vireti]
MSGYRIDLAVVHPNDPHRYFFGVECDWAMYHSSPSVKERDLNRQQFLENKSWNNTRILSCNWWKNRSVEIERIELIIKGILEEEMILQKV